MKYLLFLLLFHAAAALATSVDICRTEISNLRVDYLEADLVKVHYREYFEQGSFRLRKNILLTGRALTADLLELND